MLNKILKLLKTSFSTPIIQKPKLQKPNLRFNSKPTVPSDGIKGKTWGPSTLHQRERGHLPALRPTARSPQFSKSAPNLEKSRIASNSTSASHSEIIGKSVEGLTTTSLMKISVDDDDDDDEVEARGCFGFIRSDVSYSKRKKFSLDSEMSENIMILNEDDRLQSPDTDATDSTSSGDKKCTRNLDDVPYDRVFYRAIQKSLDDIFSRDEYNHQFVTQQNARNSKSSGDLTSLHEGEEETYPAYRFQRHNSISKFDRECFFTNKTESFEASENEVSFASVSSTQDSRRRPFDSSLEDSFNALNITYDSPTKYEERKNSMCSDQSSVDLSTASRKSSVTFRQNVDSIDSDSEQHFSSSYRPNLNDIESIFVPTTRLPQSADKLSSKERSKLSLKSALTNKIDRPRLHKLSRLFKINKTKTVVRNNSLYNKFDSSCELNEKLLDDSTTNVASNEPQYDAIFCTKNFVLAKQNENQ